MGRVPGRSAPVSSPTPNTHNIYIYLYGLLSLFHFTALHLLLTERVNLADVITLLVLLVQLKANDRGEGGWWWKTDVLTYKVRLPGW